MTAKEYLGKAYRIDQRINSKLEQVSSLRSLATKATSTLSDMPKGCGDVHSKENIIVKIIDLEQTINSDIDSLVDLKAEMVNVIKAIPNVEQQMILELRYLCFMSWEEIAINLHFSIDNVFKLHKKALNSVQVPEHYSKIHRITV